MKKINWATTQDLIDCSIHIKDDGLSTGARVEIYIDGLDGRYGIYEISHFHTVPNLILKVKKIKDNLAK